MDKKQRKEQAEELDPLRKSMHEAAEASAAGGELHLGGVGEGRQPSEADEAVERAAAGWAGRSEAEERAHGTPPAGEGRKP